MPPDYLPAHVVDWALRQRSARDWAPFVAEQSYKRSARSLIKDERVLRADPFDIGIAVITLFEAATTIQVGFEAAAFVGNAVLIAAAVGANFLLSSSPDGSGRVADFNSPVNSQEVRLNQRAPTPSKRVIYGRALVGGAMFFEKTVAPYLYNGFLIASHAIDGFEQLRIARDIIAITTTGDLPVNSIITPAGKLLDDGMVGSTPDYAGNLRASLRLGASDQAIDSLLHANFTNLATSFRQRGLASMVLRYKYPGTNYNDFQDMWGSVKAPNPLVLVRGRKVYDPRDVRQVMWSDPRDLDEVAEAEATWAWSNNAALVQADYLVQPFGGRIAPGSMRYDKVALAADYDDEIIGTANDGLTAAGTFIRRHTIDGAITLNQTPNQVLGAMLGANRGFVVQRAGAVWVQSSRPLDPVLTITDAMLTSGIDFQGQKAKRDLVNRVFSRFIAAEREYQEVDGPTYNREDLQDTDQDLLATTLQLGFTLDHRRVQRLQKAYLQSARLGKTLTVRIKLAAVADCDDDLIGACANFESDLFSPANGTYRVMLMGFADNYASLELQLVEYDPDIERDWNPDEDEQSFEVADLDVS